MPCGFVRHRVRVLTYVEYAPLPSARLSRHKPFFRRPMKDAKYLKSTPRGCSFFKAEKVVEKEKSNGTYWRNTAGYPGRFYRN